MTMLTQPRGPLERVAYRSAERATVGAGAPGTRLALIKRICVAAVTILLTGGALAGIIALKTAIYFWRFDYF
jgi:hypothetical protein